MLEAGVWKGGGGQRRKAQQGGLLGPRDKRGAEREGRQQCERAPSPCPGCTPDVVGSSFQGGGEPREGTAGCWGRQCLSLLSRRRMAGIFLWPEAECGESVPGPCPSLCWGLECVPARAGALGNTRYQRASQNACGSPAAMAPAP